jgi:hypothetical protein
MPVVDTRRQRPLAFWALPYYFNPIITIYEKIIVADRLFYNNQSWINDP